jgi:hypothetical protein
MGKKGKTDREGNRNEKLVSKRTRRREKKTQ